MAEAQPAIDEAKAQSDAERRRAYNLENLRNVGALHFAAVVAAFALFGAADTWASVSGLGLAAVVAAAAAFVAGMILSSLFHEWGHFTGAVLSGSQYKVARKPVRYFFMFEFDAQENDRRQAVWMSCGGILASWLAAGLVLLLVPMQTFAAAVLFATLVGRAVNASYFEVPIALNTYKGSDFETELSLRLESPGIVQVPGLVVGMLALAGVT